MGKKREQGKGKSEEAAEKVITGSGAEVDTRQQAAEHQDGKVKCKCTVPCVWRGYRDEGDTVWIEKELIEKDAFIRMHFKEVDGVVADAGQDGQVQDKGEGQEEGGSDNADGANGNGNGGSDNADGANGNGNGGSDKADGANGNGNGGSDNADGADGNSDGADGNGEGQGELDLK